MLRTLMTTLAMAICLAARGEGMSHPRATAQPHLSGNVYMLQVYYGREGKQFGADLDADLRELAAGGLDGLEPILESPEDADRFGSALRKAGLQMRSAYVNTTLHRMPEAQESIERVLAIADRARRYGTRILVTNPNPIQWGAPLDKSDAELATQANALNALGKALEARGLKLAYHNHDMELRQAARELHHMMCGTDPRYVKLCLDAHWIYRGSGNSSLAVFDFIKLYGKRIVEVHIRQSRGGTWSEVFGDGDLDWTAIVAELCRLRVRPHFVLEQAVEQGTPATLGAVEAISRSARKARQLFRSATKD